MRILVGWDNPQDVELMALYLNTGEHTPEFAVDPDALLQLATQDGPWDVILMTTGCANGRSTGDVFDRIRAACPEIPVVGACKADEVVQLARFIRGGLRSHIIRDAGGDYVFLLLSTLESTVNAVQAERDQQLARRLRDEVSAVRSFQQAMIADPPYSPGGYATAGRYEPSEIAVRDGASVVLAGGDYYDVFPIDNRRTGLIMADASGHGMQACLTVNVLQTLQQLVMEGGCDSAAECVAALNRRFCSHRMIRSQGGLITVLFAILHTDRNEMTWTTAGHPQPLLHDRRAGKVGPIPAEHISPPLGVVEDLTFREQTCRIPERGRMVFYTDGLTEASPDENTGVQFGLDGVRHTLLRMKDHSPAETVQSLFDDSLAFTRGNGRHDDTSVLIVERLG